MHLDLSLLDTIGKRCDLTSTLSQVLVFPIKEHSIILSLFVGGLIGEQNEGWYKVRSKVQQDLLKPQSAFYFIDDLQSISQEFAEILARKADNEQTLPKNTLSLIHLWALESIASIFLNQRLHTMQGDTEDLDSKVLTESVAVVTEYLMKLFLGAPTWKYVPWAIPWYKKLDSAMEVMSKITSKKVDLAALRILETKKNDNESNSEKCILEKLMDRATDGDLTIAKIVAQDGLLAGIDTTGNTAAFLLYNLATNHGVQEKLVQEIQVVIGLDTATKITEKHFNQMPYLKACFQESLRLTPTVVGISRKSSVKSSSSNPLSANNDNHQGFHDSLRIRNPGRSLHDDSIHDPWPPPEELQGPIRVQT